MSLYRYELLATFLNSTSPKDLTSFSLSLSLSLSLSHTHTHTHTITKGPSAQRHEARFALHNPLDQSGPSQRQLVGKGVQCPYGMCRCDACHAMEGR